MQMIYDQTSSPHLNKSLKNWDCDNWGGTEQHQRLVYTILVKLLVYQFVSPVRWIKTLDRLLKEFNFDRFIEIGPSPTLTGMSTQTLQAKYAPQDDSCNRKRLILCHTQNLKEIIYEFEDIPVEVSDSADSSTDGAPDVEPAPSVFVAPVPTATPSMATIRLSFKARCRSKMLKHSRIIHLLH